jgi:hypothetical protein
MVSDWWVLLTFLAGGLAGARWYWPRVQPKNPRRNRAQESGRLLKKRKAMTDEQPSHTSDLNADAS